MPLNAGHSRGFRKSPVARDCVVADAVVVEPVSTPEFPANREINREFRRICPLYETLKANTRAISKTFRKIPYATEQGIILAEQRIFSSGTGKFPRQIRNHHQMKFSVHTTASRLLPQFDINVGNVMLPNMPRVAPPNTYSRRREWP
jgi:hypothetical protein